MPVTISENLKQSLQKLVRDFSCSHLNSTDDGIDYLHFRVEHLLDLVLRCNEVYDVNNSTILLIKQAAILTRNSSFEESSTGYKAPKGKHCHRGRPSYIITKAQLEYYLENNFSIPMIANMICVSKSTVKRRMRKFNLSVLDTYSNIGNEELSHKIKQLISKHPNSGYRRMHSLLMSEGIKVSKSRIRVTMQKVDPEGVLTRAMQLTTVCRRQFKVPGPLALWHIDGHHKLIR